jgi:hypothetical protein
MKRSVLSAPSARIILTLFLAMQVSFAQGGQDSKGGFLVEVVKNGKTEYVPLETALVHDSATFIGLQELPGIDQNQKIDPRFNRDYGRSLAKWLDVIEQMSPKYAAVLRRTARIARFIYVDRLIVQEPDKKPDDILEYRKFKIAGRFAEPNKGRPRGIYVSIPVMEDMGNLGQGSLNKEENQGFILLHELLNWTYVPQGWDPNTVNILGTQIIEAYLHNWNPDTFLIKIGRAGVPLHFDTSLSFEFRKELLDYASEDFLTADGLHIGNKIISAAAFRAFNDLLKRYEKPLENPFTDVKSARQFFEDIKLLDTFTFWKSEGKETTAFIKNFVTAEALTKWISELIMQRNYSEELTQESVLATLRGLGDAPNSVNAAYLKSITPQELKKVDPTIGTGFLDVRNADFLKRMGEVQKYYRLRNDYSGEKVPFCAAKYFTFRLIKATEAIKENFLKVQRSDLAYFFQAQNALNGAITFSQPEIELLAEVCNYLSGYREYKYVPSALLDPANVEAVAPLLTNAANGRKEFIDKLKNLTSPKLALDIPSTAALHVSPVGSVSGLNVMKIPISTHYFLNIKNPDHPVLFEMEGSGSSYKVVTLDSHSLKSVSKSELKSMRDPEPLLLDVIVLQKEQK